MRLPGVSFCEGLTGNYWRLDAPTEERAIHVNLRAEARDVATLMRTMAWTLSGTIIAEGLACRQPLDGEISLRLLEEHRMPYRFGFTGDDGLRYELCGEKEWNSLTPILSATLLPASVYDPWGVEFARTTLRFDLRADWIRWLRGIRIRWADVSES